MAKRMMPRQSTGSWVERDIGLGAAWLRAERAVGALGLRAELTESLAAEPLSSWNCRLLDADGHMAPLGQGAGKGSPEEARVAALFEALEHYLTGPASFDPSHVRWHRGVDLAAAPFANDTVAPLLAGFERLACLEYAAVDEQPATVIPVPLGVATSWYYDHPDLRQSIGDDSDCAQLTRYASNNGSAVGVGLAEPLVHAINETIERDAISLLLASAWPGAAERALRVVDPATLPDDLAAAHQQAEELHGRPVLLLDITTDINVPSYVAALDGPGTFEARFGGGSSLSARYAAWRALAELVQGVPIRRKMPRFQLTGLERYPALRACATFDLGARLACSESVAFPRSERRLVPPQSQLRELTSRLGEAGYRPYHRVTATAPENVIAVHVIVPGLERFMLVTSGMVMVPGPRARARIETGVPA